MSPIRILVVDDSAYNRRTITRILEDIPGVQVVGYAVNGEEGLRKATDLRPDLITLDLEMPRIDGFTFLRIIMQKQPTPVIVVSSRSEDENVFKALELGAVEFVAKPTARSDVQLFDIREDLVRKVLYCARTDMRKILNRAGLPARVDKTRVSFQPTAAQGMGAAGSRLVLIGASTGGPPAIQTILSAIKGGRSHMFAISQHMPAGFTRAFAERLNKFCELEVIEARSGDSLVPGRVLVAPGGKNLKFYRRAGELLAQVADPEPGQLYLPSVDTMFSSAMEVAPVPVIAVVLTGMGNDGAQGVRKVKAGGGQIIAEAEDSCVVFGMPKEAIATGQVDSILPLAEIGPEILRRSQIALPFSRSASPSLPG
ncbi:protein-glutamate methylesterase/protein-glutamine glutaminase [Geoalkalibacter halelectricus]|uniref:Protein-glutamate methylesterase/protein-glutamine glutaminase n=1 Tax=Geoalkalibacter halelectricus TaxID=2847045 RepID=A0ABY5ZQV0_9BACT|nr:chemotaxis response regulator protein-glutamate methylesterase [Geoalkalibacter halelectricus]UWZ81552.1 chemotaxis response regulator protein-glutamate methylesterase [Geoalkalibacter halelectricus]